MVTQDEKEVFVKKKAKLLMMMLLTAVFVVALGTGVLTDGAANPINSSEATVVVVTDKGGVAPADIVSGLILVDIKARATVTIKEQAGLPIVANTTPAGSVETVINKTDIPTETMPSSTVGTQSKGSGGDFYHIGKTLASSAIEANAADTLAGANSSGGNFFHAGKNIVAFVPVKAGLMMTSIAA